MDYINYVKQSPLQGLTGLYGGVQGSLMAAAAGGGGVPNWQGGRGFSIGGHPGQDPIYTYIHAGPTGATDFGDLTVARGLFGASASSDNRICNYGGYAGGSITNVIDYFTTTSAGNATDFGNLTANRWGSGGATDGTRGVACGSDPSYELDYITFASTGNASDFGSMNNDKYNLGGTSSHEGNARGVFVGGRGGIPSTNNQMMYVTITSANNSQDFGDLTTNFVWNGVSGDGNRGVTMGGGSPGNASINYWAIMTTGNASNFGALANGNGNGACSGDGTYVVDASASSLDRITVQTTGNATDFGSQPGGMNYSTGSSGDPS